MSNHSTAHCSLCNSTSYEDLHTGDQGYTACCNEPVEYGPLPATSEQDAEAFRMWKAGSSYKVIAQHFGWNSHFDAVDAVDRHIGASK